MRWVDWLATPRMPGNSRIEFRSQRKKTTQILRLPPKTGKRLGHRLLLMNTKKRLGEIRGFPPIRDETANRWGTQHS